ncbi:hypothetical protein ANRL3_01723 [Anaerolineae bacterium]|nr:hypothetical protein ANRL3_01723 [Anaerolineae bacterium]
MKSNKSDFDSIDEYIATFPKEIQKILEELRATIKAAAPDAEEKITYQMPTFDLNGRHLVHFSVWKNHIGLYPIPAGNEAFKKEISRYKGAKSSLNFPIDKPLPLKLISKIVKFRVAENLKNAEIKSNKRKGMD